VSLSLSISKIVVFFVFGIATKFLLVFRILLSLPAEGHLPFFSFNINKLVSASFTSSSIGISSLARIFLRTLTILAFSPRNSLPSRIPPSLILLHNFFSLIIHFSSIHLLFTMHKLCNITQAATISSIFLDGTSLLFIINLYLPFNIPNDISTHILVED
jgi:hypothetical protein